MRETTGQRRRCRRVSASPLERSDMLDMATTAADGLVRSSRMSSREPSGRDIPTGRSGLAQLHALPWSVWPGVTRSTTMWSTLSW